MLYVGIDIAKYKHDCYIRNAQGDKVIAPFIIENSLSGFNLLWDNITATALQDETIKVGLEATGHYSYNIIGFLLSKPLELYIINPLLTHIHRKGLSLRKTKTDKVDAKTIAHLLMSDIDLKPYSLSSYHNQTLKSLTRYRFNMVKQRAKLKTTIARLLNIVFPELESLVSSVHLKSIYTMLEAYPSAKSLSKAHIKRLGRLLQTNAKGHLNETDALRFKKAAKASIGLASPAETLELQHTIKRIRLLNQQIEQVEEQIKALMDQTHTVILSIPGIGYRMGALIVAEIGDIERFSSADKLLAFAGMVPSVYQSGQFTSTHAHMEKRGSKYLRYALFNATKHVCMHDKTFATYLAKKRAEGKHYNVAITHAAKKLMRLIFALIKSNQTYTPAY